MKVHARLIELDLFNDSSSGGKFLHGLLLAVLVLVQDLGLDGGLDVLLPQLLLGLVVFVGLVSVELLQLSIARVVQRSS